MDGDRKLVRAPAVERRPAVAARAPVAAVGRVGPVGAGLQQRLGNLGTQALGAQVVSRSCAGCTSTRAASSGQLSVSQPSDASEREAERVADVVMRMPAAAPTFASISSALAPLSAPAIQQSCAVCEAEHARRGASIQEISASRPSATQARAPLIQAKLTVSQPGDAYEQEADRVAEQVMRMPVPMESMDSRALHDSRESQAGSPTTSDRVAQVQRKCACGGTCDSCKTGQVDEGQGTVQRKSIRPQLATAGSSPATTAMSAPPSVDQVLRSPGQPLAPSVRAFFEPRFGTDFSQVRVHADSAAQQSAQDINANAYTLGQNIAFGPGRFAPETQEGRRLLAHELTHVVQQSSQSANRIHPSSQGFVQRQTCRGILDADEVRGATRGIEVEAAVRVDLIDKLGGQNVVQGLSIPGASSRLERMEECGGFKRTMPPRQGHPDLAFRQYPRGRTVELAEVKIGTWPCLWLAEVQVGKYVERANENEKFKRDMGVDNFKRMPTSRFAPSQLRDRVTGIPVDVAWCGPGVIVYKAVANRDKEKKEEPRKKEPPKKKERPEQAPPVQGPSLGPIPLPELFELGAKVLGLLAADVVLSAGLGFVASLVPALAPLLALAALAVGIVLAWDKIKSLAQMIAGAAKLVLNKILAVVALVADVIKKVGIKMGELAVWVGGFIKGLAEKIGEGLLWAGRRALAGGKWLGRQIASGAEAIWDWLWGSDVEPIAPKIELPVTEEPTKRCGTVARDDALIQISSDLLFPFGEWELTKLTPEGHAALKGAAAKVLSTPRTSNDPVRFQGFTDNVGSHEFNRKLSERRAGAVAEWFVQHGVIPMSKVEIRGFGKTEAKGNDPEGRKKDRRVDILVTKKGSVEKVCW